MTPEFCVCVVNNAHWWLKDYANHRCLPYFAWTSNPDEAHRFTHHEAAIALAQLVKHVYPDQTVRLMEFPQNKVQHDTNPT